MLVGRLFFIPRLQPRVPQVKTWGYTTLTFGKPWRIAKGSVFRAVCLFGFRLLVGACRDAILCVWSQIYNPRLQPRDPQTEVWGYNKVRRDVSRLYLRFKNG